MEKTLVGALVHYFGRLPGQDTASFQAEIKALNDADRAYFKRELERVGYKIIPPALG